MHYYWTLKATHTHTHIHTQPINSVRRLLRVRPQFEVPVKIRASILLPRTCSFNKIAIFMEVILRKHNSSRKIRVNRAQHKLLLKNTAKHATRLIARLRPYCKSKYSSLDVWVLETKSFVWKIQPSTFLMHSFIALTSTNFSFLNYSSISALMIFWGSETLCTSLFFIQSGSQGRHINEKLISGNNNKVICFSTNFNMASGGIRLEVAQIK